MKTILADPERRTATVHITVTSVEDRNTILKNVIWFCVKHHCVDLFMESSLDTLCATCGH